jgi:hypothetical protein
VAVGPGVNDGAGATEGVGVLTGATVGAGDDATLDDGVLEGATVAHEAAISAAAARDASRVVGVLAP